VGLGWLVLSILVRPARGGRAQVISRRVKRLVLGLVALVIAWLCSACIATADGGLDDIPPANRNSAPASVPITSPPASVPITSPPASAPTPSGEPQQETLAFGKSYTWDDGVRVTVGKPKEFQPSGFAAVEKDKRYVKFTVTVANKSNKRLDLGLTYISVRSDNEEADQIFDSGTGLTGPPDVKVLKRREAKFDVGFAVTDPKDLVMEVALHDNPVRPNLLYST
jgi:hypothetical protein